MNFVARFQVDGAEARQVPGIEEDWVGVLVFSKTFTAGIVGSATTLFLASGTEGSRSYVATERISGHTEGGEGGALTVQHGGLEADPSVRFGHIVPNTGTGDFAGWEGSMRIEHDAEGAFMVFDLTAGGPPH
jgi:hypothetical protein